MTTLLLYLIQLVGFLGVPIGIALLVTAGVRDQ